MAPDDSTARNPIGPVGRQLIENLTDLRNKRRLSYTELAAELEKIGRPIPVLGLSRIEKGKRRVDVDDLIALAIVLGVNPTALLLPRRGGNEDVVGLTSAVRPSMLRAWRWMDGAGPLPQGADDRVSWQEIADFAAHARPEDEQRPELIRELMERYGQSAPAGDAQ